MKLLVPQGIGDSIWSVFKMQAIAKAHNDPIIDVSVGCWHTNHIECRAKDFLKRFTFINSVEMKVMPRKNNLAPNRPMPIRRGINRRRVATPAPVQHNTVQHGPMLLPGPPADADGYYRYIPDGPSVVPGIDYVLVANTPLERGIRLEEWLPQFETNWNILDDFQFSLGELSRAEAFSRRHSDFVVFYMSAESGNGHAGHNRGGIWKPQDWVELGTALIKKYDVKIIVVGADYDASYYRNQVAPLVGPSDMWVDCIGESHIGETFARIRHAKAIIAYQSGIGIVGNYFGIPTAMFWRQKGDSIDPKNYISFEEGMASAWANPKMIAEGKHLPLIYGRHGASDILDEIQKRGWIE